MNVRGCVSAPCASLRTTQRFQLDPTRSPWLSLVSYSPTDCIIIVARCATAGVMLMLMWMSMRTRIMPGRHISRRPLPIISTYLLSRQGDVEVRCGNALSSRPSFSSCLLADDVHLCVISRSRIISDTSASPLSSARHISLAHLAASPSATPLWPLAKKHFFCAVVALVALITYRGSKAYRGAV